MARRPRTNPGDPSHAVAYLRTSTSDQTLGLDAQRVRCVDYAERSGLEIRAWFSEQESGTLPVESRPELLAALAALEGLRAGVLLVARRDRLARDAVIAGIIERHVSRVGARVVSAAGEGSDDPGPSGVFLRQVIDATSQFEGASTRLRTRAALAARRAKGLRVGTIPYGCTADELGRLTPHEGEQRTLARVRELVSIGHTIDEATAVLRREGYRARSGRPFSRSRVGALFLLVRTTTKGPDNDDGQ